MRVPGVAGYFNFWRRVGVLSVQMLKTAWMVFRNAAHVSGLEKKALAPNALVCS